MITGQINDWKTGDLWSEFLPCTVKTVWTSGSEKRADKEDGAVFAFRLAWVQEPEGMPRLVKKKKGNLP
jgi:hypothetical protein